MPSLLTRTVLWEMLRLLCFYGTAYLVLISIAVAAPLVRGGAPLLDVLLFLPNQLTFPVTLALPLALVTATLSCLARMREDGELTALMAAGIGTPRVVLATLPLALLMVAVVGWLAHVVMPLSHVNFASKKSALLRQAMATKVARQEPIYQQEDPRGLNEMALAAITVDGDELGHIFGWQRSETGMVYIGYAPTARWQTQRFEERPTMTTPAVPVAEIDAFISRFITNTEKNQQRSFDRELVERALRLLLAEANQGQRIREVTRLQLCFLDGRFLSHTETPPAGAPPPASGSESVLMGGSGGTVVPHPVMAAQMPRWHIVLDHTENGQRPPEALSSAELAAQIEVRQTILILADPQLVEAKWRPAFLALLADAPRLLREFQYSYHLRWMMTFAVLGYWLLACGLGLVVPARNRLVAVFIGLAAVIGTMLPAIAILKGAGAHLTIHPAWILWLPPGLTSLVGLGLLWRKR